MRTEIRSAARGAASGRNRTAIAFSRLAERDIGGFVPQPGFS